MSDWTDYTYSLRIRNNGSAREPSDMLRVDATLERLVPGHGSQRKDIDPDTARDRGAAYVQWVEQRNPEMAPHQVLQRALHEWWTAIEEGRELPFGPEQEIAGRWTSAQWGQGLRLRDCHDRVWNYSARTDTWSPAELLPPDEHWPRSYAALLADFGPLTKEKAP